MIPLRGDILYPTFRLSRVCGDDPVSASDTGVNRLFVPRMRGWSQWQECLQRPFPVCPAYAGMILKTLPITYSPPCLSRVCGDDPNETRTMKDAFLFVPRMRGWSRGTDGLGTGGNVCPAYAGMIPRLLLLIRIRMRLSRVCGDDPGSRYALAIQCWFVPRMRGWSYTTQDLENMISVCPAYAGMIPLYSRFIAIAVGLSRVCGDDPGKRHFFIETGEFVPRMRGWSQN